MHTYSAACETPVRAFTESGGTATGATTALHTAATASVGTTSAATLATAPVYTTAAATPAIAAAAAAAAAVVDSTAAHAAAATVAADVKKLQLMHKILQQCVDRSDSAESKLESISFLVQSAAVQEAAARSTAAACIALPSAEAAVVAELKRLQQMHRLLLQTVDCSDSAESKLASITFIVLMPMNGKQWGPHSLCIA
jgi:hypothetical protein